MLSDGTQSRTISLPELRNENNIFPQTGIELTTIDFTVFLINYFIPSNLNFQSTSTDKQQRKS